MAKRYHFEGKNNFSCRVTPTERAGDATLFLCQLAASLRRPAYFQLADPQRGSYAAVVAVANDPEKLQQLDALVKSWNEKTGDHP